MEKAPKRVPNYTGDVAASSLKKMQAERQRKLTEKIINDFGWRYGYTTTRLSGDSVMTTKLTGARDLLPVDYVTVYTPPSEVAPTEKVSRIETFRKYMARVLYLEASNYGQFALVVREVVSFMEGAHDDEAMYVYDLYGDPDFVKDYGSIVCARFDRSDYDRVIAVFQKNNPADSQTTQGPRTQIFCPGWAPIIWDSLQTIYQTATVSVLEFICETDEDGSRHLRYKQVISSSTYTIRDYSNSTTGTQLRTNITTDYNLSKSVVDVYADGATIKLLANCTLTTQDRHWDSTTCNLGQPAIGRWPDKYTDMIAYRPNIQATYTTATWVEFDGSEYFRNTTSYRTAPAFWAGAEYAGGGCFMGVFCLDHGSRYSKGQLILSPGNFIYSYRDQTLHCAMDVYGGNIWKGDPSHGYIPGWLGGEDESRTSYGASGVSDLRGHISYIPDSRWDNYEYFTGAVMTKMSKQLIGDCMLNHSAFFTDQMKDDNSFSAVADMRFDIRFSYIAGFQWENFDACYGFKDGDVSLDWQVQNEIQHYVMARETHEYKPNVIVGRVVEDSLVGFNILHPSSYGGLKWGNASTDAGFKIYLFNRDDDQTELEDPDKIFMSEKTNPMYTFPGQYYTKRYAHSSPSTRNWLCDVQLRPYEPLELETTTQ